MLTSLSVVMLGSVIATDAIAMMGGYPQNTEYMLARAVHVGLNQFGTEELKEAYEIFCSDNAEAREKEKAKNTLYEFLKITWNDERSIQTVIDDLSKKKACDPLLKLLTKVRDLRPNGSVELYANDIDDIHMYELFAQIFQGRDPLFPFAKLDCWLPWDANGADFAAFLHLLYDAKMLNGVNIYPLDSDKATAFDSLKLFYENLRLPHGALETFGLNCSTMRTLEARDWTLLLELIYMNGVTDFGFQGEIVRKEERVDFWRNLSVNDHIARLIYSQNGVDAEIAESISRYSPRNLREAELTFNFKSEEEQNACVDAMFNMYNDVLKRCPEIVRIRVLCDVNHPEYDKIISPTKLKAIVAHPILCKTFYDKLTDIDWYSCPEKTICTVFEVLEKIKKHIEDGGANVDVLSDDLARDLNQLNAPLKTEVLKLCEPLWVESLIRTCKSGPALILQAAFTTSLRAVKFNEEDLPLLGDILKTSFLWQRIQDGIQVLTPALDFSYMNRPALAKATNMIKKLADFRPERIKIASSTDGEAFLADFFSDNVSDLAQILIQIDSRFSRLVELTKENEEKIRTLSGKLKEIGTDYNSLLSLFCEKNKKEPKLTLRDTAEKERQNIQRLETKAIKLRDSFDNNMRKAKTSCEGFLSWNERFTRDLGKISKLSGKSDDECNAFQEQFKKLVTETVEAFKAMTQRHRGLMLNNGYEPLLENCIDKDASIRKTLIRIHREEIDEQ